MATTSRRARAPKSTALATTSAGNDNAPAQGMSFAFGDPEPVLNRRAMLGLDHMECWHNGRWYEPPISLSGLTAARHASPHHASALKLKVNLLAKSFVPHRLLSRAEFAAIALDYLALGNCYLEERRAMSNRPLQLVRSPAKYTRRGLDLETYFFLDRITHGGVYGEPHEYRKGTVCHLLEPDLDQEVYGAPEYICALQAAFLNEAATIFRRRYYLNGSHAGFILYMNDAAQTQAEVDALRQAMKDSKGPGNFRNLFIYSPSGKKDGIQVIPVSEVAAKDEFLGIKNTSRDDVLAAHRVPPQLLGVVPQTAGGFGDVAKAADVFHSLEIEPLQTVFLQINDWVGEEVVKYRPYAPLSTGGAPANDR